LTLKCYFEFELAQYISVAQYASVAQEAIAEPHYILNTSISENPQEEELSLDAYLIYVSMKAYRLV
jgi:hypothetical protein